MVTVVLGQRYETADSMMVNAQLFKHVEWTASIKEMVTFCSRLN